MLTVFKVVRADATDFYTGKFTYAPGALLEEPNADIESKDPCGRGLHVSPTARATCQYGNRGIDRGRWRWFERRVHPDDVIAKDSSKFRVRKLQVVREVFKDEIFGADLAKRIEDVRTEAATWKSIPWLKPTSEVTQAQIEFLLGRWHDALLPWHLRRGGAPEKMPRLGRIVRKHEEANRLLSYRDAADAAADAAAALFRSLRWYPWWYVRPHWVLRRSVYGHLGGPTDANPAAPLVEMYRLGALPLGYMQDPKTNEVAFTVYLPEVRA